MVLGAPRNPPVCSLEPRYQCVSITPRPHQCTADPPARPTQPKVPEPAPRSVSDGMCPIPPTPDKPTQKKPSTPQAQSLTAALFVAALLCTKPASVSGLCPGCS